MEHYKSWSGLNQWLTECLCDEMKGRIQYFFDAIPQGAQCLWPRGNPSGRKRTCLLRMDGNVSQSVRRKCGMA